MSNNCLIVTHIWKFLGFTSKYSFSIVYTDKYMFPQFAVDEWEFSTLRINISKK